MIDKNIRTSIHDRIDLLQAGKDPYMIARLESGWVCLSDQPFIEGHCVFFADPVAFSINDLSEIQRMAYSRDVCKVGDALIKALGAYRINYETMCNVAQSLHSHITPRFESEPEAKRRERPALAYPNPLRSQPDAQLAEKIKRHL